MLPAVDQQLTALRVPQAVPLPLIYNFPPLFLVDSVHGVGLGMHISVPCIRPEEIAHSFVLRVTEENIWVLVNTSSDQKGVGD